jgi:thiosulfate/3-mercaptopyruvate sulfurtransferase
VDVTREELASRLGDPELAIFDVRSPEEFSGESGYTCDARQGHLPGAVNVPVHDLLGLEPDAVRERIGLPEGAEVVAYCHSGGRSAIAVSVLRAAGYNARNYVGSWHEWSHDPGLPAE